MQYDAVSCIVNILGHEILDLVLPGTGNCKQLDLIWERKFGLASSHLKDGQLGSVVEIELVLPTVHQIKDADYEPVSAKLLALIVIKHSVQSRCLFVALGEVPDFLLKLRVGDGRIEVLVKGLDAQLFPSVQILQYAHGGD